MITFDTMKHGLNNELCGRQSTRMCPKGAVDAYVPSNSPCSTWNGHTPKEIIIIQINNSTSKATNNQIRIVSLGEEVCELKYLKSLTVSAYGMNELPENFIKLGGKADK